MRVSVWLCLAAVLIVAGCQDSAAPSAAPKKPGAKTDVAAAEPAASTPASEGWGTVKGRVVFGGGSLPAKQPLQIEKDRDHCLSAGPLFAENWVVDPQNKGVRYAVAFIKPARGKPLAVHPSLQSPPPEVAVDQPTCRFEPHVICLQAGQKLLAKNPAPIAHNVTFNGLKNNDNVQVPPGGSHRFEPVPENNAIRIGCGAHPWMTGWVWVLEHPYFAVTDAGGHFELKNVPAGSHQLILWQEAVGLIPDAKGRTVNVTANGVADIGDVVIKP